MNKETKPGASEESRKGLAVGIAVFVVILVAAMIGYNALTAGNASNSNLQGAASSSASNAADRKVPDFTVTDADGTAVSIRSFEGKPTVLNFWASTCGPCQSEMPHFQAAYEAHGDAVNFVMVDIPGFNGETTTRAIRFLENSGYTFPAYFDTEGDASRAFGITSIPRTYFIDAEGDIIVAGSGALNESALQQGLQALGIS